MSQTEITRRQSRRRPDPEGDAPNQPAGSVLEEVLKTKTAEEIMHPELVASTYKMTDRDGDEHEFEVLPMTEDGLIVIADSLEQIIALFDGLSNDPALKGMKLSDKDIGDKLIRVLAPIVLPRVPQILKILLPHSTALIAASLGVLEPWVRANFTLPMRLEVLTLIVEAEDIPALLKTLGALMTAFQKATGGAAPTTETTA